MQFKWPTNLSILLMAIWFLLTGAFGLFHLTFEAEGIFMAILAFVTGILLLLGK